MKTYSTPELQRLREWQRRTIFWFKKYASDESLHAYLDKLGVPRSAYGYKDCTDGAYARIGHYVGYLKGENPLILRKP